MQKNKLSLGAFTKAISQAVSEANRRLLEEAAQEEMLCAPDPLCISRMRVSFSARISRSARLLRDSGTAELMLDFERGGPNFHGEMVFLPFAQADASWEDIAAPGEDDTQIGWNGPAADWDDAGPLQDANGPRWGTELPDDTKKVAVRPLEQTGGFDNGNR